MHNYVCTPALAAAVAIRVATKNGRNFVALPDPVKGGMKHSATAFLDAYFDLLREEPALGPILPDEPKLTRQARVGGTTFGVGVAWSTVIAAAYRNYLQPESALRNLQLTDAELLDHAVHAYMVASVARMAMETDPDGDPTVAVMNASIREGLRAAFGAVASAEVVRV